MTKSKEEAAEEWRYRYMRSVYKAAPPYPSERDAQIAAFFAGCAFMERKVVEAAVKALVNYSEVARTWPLQRKEALKLIEEEMKARQTGNNQEEQEKRTGKCIICDSAENLKVCPVMTGDSFDRACKYPVCDYCIRMWYETGITDRDELRARVFKEREEALREEMKNDKAS